MPLRIFCVVASLFPGIIPGPAHAAGVLEKYVRACSCPSDEFEFEVLTQSGTKADCVSSEFAVEIDQARNWAQSLGQALHYSAVLGRRAKIVLFCPPEYEHLCSVYATRLVGTIAHYKLDVTVELFANESLFGGKCEYRGY